MVERRSSEILSTQLTDDGPVYHALGVHLSRAKLITRPMIDMPWQNFLIPAFRKKFRREVPLFLSFHGDLYVLAILIFLKEKHNKFKCDLMSESSTVTRIIEVNEVILVCYSSYNVQQFH